MRTNAYLHPCGFCGVDLEVSLKCPGCGVWWSHRNFWFPGERFHHTGMERDADANGWLSNSTRLLEEPVERFAPLGSEE